MSDLPLHFIISAPRSGSTWLMNALNQHPDVFATEQRLFGNFCEMWPNNNGNLAPRITFDAYARAVSVHYQFTEFSESRSGFCDQFIAEYMDFLVDFAKRKTGCSLIVDKITPYPGTSKFVVAQIRKFVPDARIFKLVRDGRDVLTSGTFDWLLKDGTNTDRYQYFVEQKRGMKLNRFFDDDTIEKWAKIWKETLTVMPEVPQEQTIRYENMIHDLPGVLQKLFHSFELPVKNGIASRAAAAVTFSRSTGRKNGVMDATSKQRKGIVGDWKNFMTQQDANLFHQLAGKFLIREGYEQDDSWIAHLPKQLDLEREDTYEGAVEN